MRGVEKNFLKEKKIERADLLPTLVFFFQLLIIGNSHKNFAISLIDPISNAFSFVGTSKKKKKILA